MNLIRATKKRGLNRIRIELTVKRLKDIIRYSNNILDIGVGPDIYWHNIIGNGVNSNIVGIDISSNHLRSARKNNKGFFLIQSDVRYLPFRYFLFDLIFLFEVIEHIPKKDRLKLLKEIYNASKGIFILTTPLSDTLISIFLKTIRAIPKTHLYEYRFNELIKLVRKTGFKIIRYEMMMLYHIYKIIPKILIRGFLSKVLGRSIILYLRTKAQFMK